MKLIVFCVESDKKAQTDNKYIDKAIRNYYCIDNNIKIAYINMNGKGNYNNKSTIRQIKRLFSGDFEEKYVVYCVDIDKSSDIATVNLNKNIENFCAIKSYNFVWFCKDIEEVFLHKHVSDSDKVSESNKFMRTTGIGEAKREYLHSNSQTPRHSNLLVVLDSFMLKQPM